ncbi:MAG: hypothetical protein HQK83_06845 [Fibrobacteria bacterium]|nr:hypothetical protein [Fibrobacteria bacterium]
MVTLSSGQIQVEDSTFSNDFVIEIDTGQSKNIGKSLTLALGFSLLAPGSGEYYLRDKKKAKLFALFEVGFWSALYFSWMAKQAYLESARQYAWEYAGIDATDKDEQFLSTMTRYRSYKEIHHRKDSYESIQILSGKREQDYDIPASEENYWDFGSAAIPENTNNWNQFIDATKAYGRADVALTWAIGGLILGRVLSFINTLHLYRTTSVKGLTQAGNGELPMAASPQKPSWNFDVYSVVLPGKMITSFHIRF